MAKFVWLCESILPFYPHNSYFYIIYIPRVTDWLFCFCCLIYSSINCIPVKENTRNKESDNSFSILLYHSLKIAHVVPWLRIRVRKNHCRHRQFESCCGHGMQQGHQCTFYQLIDAVPTTKNYAPKISALEIIRIIKGASPTGVQWKSLALEVPS